MANLLSMPDNVMVQHLFPNLDHNDLVSLRRVCKQTKALVDAYLWTPKPDHQGKWELKIDYSKEDQTLEAFLKRDLPPPSRIHIVNKGQASPFERTSFFKDKHLDEFMRRYSKYVTHLKLDKMFFPFTSTKEIDFYESLVNLEQLQCTDMKTFRARSAANEDMTKIVLLRPAWSKKLKIFRLTSTSCMDHMYNFINGLSSNLEELLHPLGFYGNEPVNFAPIQQLIKRSGGMKNQSKLVYDWMLFERSIFNPIIDSDLVPVLANCHDNGVKIKNLSGQHLSCIQRNPIYGSIILSWKRVSDAACCLELPVLESITMHSEGRNVLRHRDGYPEWPNLRKLNAGVRRCVRRSLHFLDGGLKLPKLEELSLIVLDTRTKDFSLNLGVSCGNVRKLFISGSPGNDFFLMLWEELPLLEDVTLNWCSKLTNKGFVGNGVRGSTPAFLKLTKLKCLTIKNPLVTDSVFRNVFRHLKLTSFTLSSERAIKRITIGGIKELLTGPFSETIQKLDLDGLQLKDVSDEEMMEVASCIRVSKLL